MKLALPDSRKCLSVCTGCDILYQASLLLRVSVIIKQILPTSDSLGTTGMAVNRDSHRITQSAP